MRSDFQQAMRDLLLVSYPDDTIRDFIHTLPGGPQMKFHLPGPGASAWALADTATTLLLQFERAEEALDAVEQERPARRDQVVEIRAMLEDLEPPPLAGVWFNPAPSLPANYVERGPLAGFCESIKRVTGHAGVTGPLGAGKTIFAAAAARSTELGKTFARVCWVSLEEGSDAPVVELQKQLYAQLSGETLRTVDWRDGRVQLAERASKLLATGERLLVVVDSPPDPIDRVVEALQIHRTMSLIFCTENRAALHSLGAKPVVELNGLQPHESLELLALWCGCSPGELPPAAGEIAEAVGGLPLAVAVIGAMVSLAGDRAAEWAALKDDLRSGKVARLELPGLNTNVLMVLGKALRSLDASSREELHTLALVPANHWLTPDQLAQIWATSGVDDARRRADYLTLRSLLRRVDPSCYALHLLPRLVLRAADERLAERFREVASRYAPESPPLVLALSWGDSEVFDALVRVADADEVNRTAPQGVTALHIAALHGSISTTEALLGRGADPRRASDDGFDALQYAAQEGVPQTVKVLLGTSADPTHRNSGGKTALDIAARNGRIEAVRLLAAVPGAVQAAEFALLGAAGYGHTDVVAMLLAAGMGTDISPAGNSPPLHAAAAKGQAQIVEMLLRAGAKVDILFNDQTPLFLAATEGHEQIVDLLVRAGADPRWKTGSGRTVMHQAAQSGTARIIERLAEAGSPIDASDERGHTPLHIAATLGHAGVVKALVTRGAELDRFGGDQLTPLHRAVAGSHPDTVEELLAAGADPSRPGQRGFSPLLFAVAMALPSIVKENQMSMDEDGTSITSATVYQPVSPKTVQSVRALAAAGAELNAEDENGQTALHWAVRKQSPELTRLILELGADRAKQDRQGRTPAALAEIAARVAEAEGPLVSLRALAVESLLSS